MARVRIEHLSKVYKTEKRTVRAVENINLEIKDGEFVCVVGHSGCGKTTLLNILAKFVTPTSGQVLLDGKSLEAAETNVGVVFQEYALFPWCTALGNVAFGLEMHGYGKKERTERAMHYLKLVQLDDFADVHPHQLSGGMRQRVAVARALAYDPALLLMDEPFGALDAQTRERLQELTEDVWRKTTKTIFYVTHNIAEAVYLAERVVVMRPNPGHIHAVVDIDLPRPRDPLSRAFVDVQRHITEMIMEDKPKGLH